MGEVTLDANAYRAAVLKLSTNNESAASVHATDLKTHIDDVRAAQRQMNLSDILFQKSDTVIRNPKQLQAGGWMEPAVSAAKKHKTNLMKIVGEDVAVLNIFALSALGTLEIQVLAKIQTVLGQVDGVILVMHPTLPSKVHSLRAGLPSGQPLATQDAGSDSENDVDNHDFGSSGTLPEALTKAVSKLSPKQRAHQLAKDIFTIESIGAGKP